jgi:hypothetical protein
MAMFTSSDPDNTYPEPLRLAWRAGEYAGCATTGEADGGVRRGAGEAVVATRGLNDARVGEDTLCAGVIEPLRLFDFGVRFALHAFDLSVGLGSIRGGD